MGSRVKKVVGGPNSVQRLRVLSGTFAAQFVVACTAAYFYPYASVYVVAGVSFFVAVGGLIGLIWAVLEGRVGGLNED